MGNAPSDGYDEQVPKLVCRTCGRQVYTVAPLDALFAEERRCPRCGAYMDNERRLTDRRQHSRRLNPPDVPGAPPAVAERRVAERRVGRRRRGERGGWVTP